MKSSLKIKESELRAETHIRSASNSHEGQRKWILYQIGSKDPLLGFVHASSKVEALDRVAGFRLPVIAVEAEATTIDAEPMTPERIARRYQLFGSIIPSYSDDTDHRRTSYFYRKQAVEWARMARQWWPGAAMRPICRRLAKHYLAQYRFMQATA